MIPDISPGIKAISRSQYKVPTVTTKPVIILQNAPLSFDFWDKNPPRRAGAKIIDI